MSVAFGNTSFVTKDLILYFDPNDRRNYILSEVEVLVVAGGGGGGNYNSAGGGGAGGVIYRSFYPVTPGSAISVTVGTGGGGGSGNNTTPPTNGGNSVFGNLTAIGGGFGSPNVANSVGDGGSGGGGGYTRQLGGTGTSGQGFAGGHGGGPSSGAPNYPGGGGGGAGGPGGNSQHTSRAGNGGPGLPFSISGTLRYYGGGGGGSTQSGGAGGSGGIGGGGRGGSSVGGENAVANTGGGGGAGGYDGTTYSGGSGGSGVVIVRYPGPQKATGGNTILFANGYTVHTFTSGTSSFTPSSFPSNGTAINGLQDLTDSTNSCYSSGGPTYNSSEDGYIQFDGTDDFLNGNIRLGRSATVEFVAKADWTQNNGGQPIPVAIDGDMYGSGPNIFLGYNSSSQFFIYNNVGDGYSNPFSNSGLPSSSVYVHFVVVNDFLRSTARLYQNGSLVGTASVLDMRTTGINKFWIGRWHGGGYRVNMRLGPVRVYNRELSASEVLTNFNSLKGRYGL